MKSAFGKSIIHCAVQTRVKKSCSVRRILKSIIPQTLLQVYLEFSSVRDLVNNNKKINLQITSICISIPESDPKIGMAG